MHAGRLLAATLLAGACVSEPQRSPPSIAVEPNSIDFGAVEAGTTAVRYLQIRNTGGTSLAVGSLAISGDERTAFDWVAPPIIVVPSGGLVEVMLTYAAAADRLGTDTARLTIESNASNASSVDVSIIALTAGFAVDGGMPDAGDADGGDGVDPDGGESDAGPQRCRTPVCPSAEWCWDSPLPLGSSIDALWSRAADDVWAATGSGMLHYDGSEWTRSEAPGFRHDVFGFASNDVWASGAGAAHFDGTSWAIHPSSTDLLIDSLWGSGPSDVWATNFDTFAHYDGVGWQSIPDPFPGNHFFFDIFGFAMNDIFAISSEGQVAHFDGINWSLLRPGCGNGVPCSDSDFLLSIWGADPGDIWFGAMGVLLRYDGRNWNEVTPISPTSGFYDIWGSSAVDVWFASSGIYRWDGSNVLITTAPAGLYYAVAGSGALDVWFGGSEGRLVHWNGSGFSSYGCGITGSFNAVWIANERDIWAVGTSGSIPVLAHSVGGDWAVVPGVTPGTEDIFGIAPDRIYTVGVDKVVRYDGNEWTDVAGAPSGYWGNVWASGANDLWIAGFSGDDGVIAHYDGSWSTSTITAGGRIADIFGAQNGVWAVGFSALGAESVPFAMQYDGQRWTRTALPSNGRCYAVWADAATPFAMAACQSGIFQWTNNSWSATNETQSFYSLSGTGPDDVWAAGPLGIAHWNGNEWTRAPRSDAPFELNAIHTSAAGVVWGVGYNAIVRHVP